MVWYTFDLCFIHPRRHFSLACLPQPFHLLPTHGTLILTLSLLFIRSRTNQRLRPSRRHFSSACLPQPFHLLPTHGTLILTPLLLFIHSWTNQRPRPRFKAQYIILGPYPYTSNMNFLQPKKIKIKK